MTTKHEHLAELVNQIASNPKAASAVAAYSTAVGSMGLLTDVKDWLSVISLLLGVILSSIMIGINLPILWSKIHQKDDANKKRRKNA